jgi:hypothetical protein
MVCMSYIRLWLILWTPCGTLTAYSTAHVGGAVSPLHCCTCTGPPQGPCVLCAGVHSVSYCSCFVLFCTKSSHSVTLCVTTIGRGPPLLMLVDTHNVPGFPSVTHAC